MSRLIDADALIKNLELMAKYQPEHKQSTILGVCAIIKATCSIDAVPVVRCKDCVYKSIPKCCPCQIGGFKVTGDWFCPMGVMEVQDG